MELLMANVFKTLGILPEDESLFLSFVMVLFFIILTCIVVYVYYSCIPYKSCSSCKNYKWLHHRSSMRSYGYCEGYCTTAPDDVGRCTMKGITITGAAQGHENAKDCQGYEKRREQQ